jgi:HD-GYP domain-containing protein (c-di-GMP phosphodiesterase class II)
MTSRKLISAVRQHGVDSHEKAQNLYDNAVAVIREMLGKISMGEDINLYNHKLSELLDDVFNQLVMGDNILISVYEKKKEEYYLPYHIVNCLLLSSVIGLNMGFNKSRLSHLGLACIFYDTGLDNLKELICRPNAITGEGRGVIDSHIDKSLRIAERIECINDVVKETIRTHHERMNGAGYPRGIKADEINAYAKIIGLVDTYEAITHIRPYREEMNTHKAVRTIVGPMKNYFDADVMKIFINKMSVYPIGSIVKLDTEETARVISAHPGSPLRPVIMILNGADGSPVRERTIIDLSKQDFPSIKDSVQP